MVIEDIVYTASVFSIAVLVFLVLANLVIIGARFFKAESFADKIVRRLGPFASLFRIGSQAEHREDHRTIRQH